MEEENIKVVVRIRPLQLNEKKSGDFPIVEAINKGKEVQVKVGPLDAQNYRCNRCFSNDTTQTSFFHESGITDLLDSAIDGYRTCAFAFGQTGAGKTFTMFGSPSKTMNHKDKQYVGMVNRSIEYLFVKLHELNITKFSLKICCLEIYQEHVYDLFAEERERVSLPVREHMAEGFFLEGCKMIECSDYDMATTLLEIAMKNRQVGGHELNSRSSRSHCLTDIFIETPANGRNDNLGDRDEDEGNEMYVTKGRVSLVDLAGSERLKSTNSTGKILQEAGFINKSLYVLGKVIAGLVRTNGDLNHKDVPYRDSKLTKLLISSLCGRSRTLLISCVSEAKGSQAETLRTLKFSMSCARIKNKPVKFLDPHDKIIIELREEIKRLRNENKKLRSHIVTAPAVIDKSYTLSDDDNDIISVVSKDRASSADNNSYKSIKLREEKARKAKRSAKNKDTAFMNKLAAGVKLPAHYVKSPTKSKMKGKSKDHNYDDYESDSIYNNKSKKGSIAYDEEPFDEDNEEEDDESTSSSHRKRMTQSQLEDVIRRRAVGPMIFKSAEKDILPIKVSMGQAQEDSDRKLKSIFARGTKTKKTSEVKAKKIKKGHDDSDSRTTLDEYMKGEKEISEHQGKKIKKIESMDKKQNDVKPKKKNPSPYIAHIKDPHKEIKQDKKVYVKKAEIKERVEAWSDKDDNSVASKKSISIVKEKKIATSILDELEALGLSPTEIKEANANLKDNKPKQKNKSTPALEPNNKQNIKSKAENKHSSLPNLPKAKAPHTKEIKQRETHVVLPNIKPKDVTKTEESIPLFDKKVIPDNIENEGVSVKAIRNKLEVLEKSLATERENMEDNPGFVTTEEEERVTALEKEAKSIRLELDLSSKVEPQEDVNDGYEDEEFYGDEDFEADEEATATTKDDKNNTMTTTISSKLVDTNTTNELDSKKEHIKNQLSSKEDNNNVILTSEKSNKINFLNESSKLSIKTEKTEDFHKEKSEEDNDYDIEFEKYCQQRNITPVLTANNSTSNIKTDMAYKEESESPQSVASPEVLMSSPFKLSQPDMKKPESPKNISNKRATTPKKKEEEEDDYGDEDFTDAYDDDCNESNNITTNSVKVDSIKQIIPKVESYKESTLSKSESAEEAVSKVEVVKDNIIPEKEIIVIKEKEESVPVKVTQPPRFTKTPSNPTFETGDDEYGDEEFLDFDD